jgi:hypothetical protein
MEPTHSRPTDIHRVGWTTSNAGTAELRIVSRMMDAVA